MKNNLSNLMPVLDDYLFEVSSVQDITSAKTSINASRIPSLFSNKIFLRECSDFVFDFGCGSYTKHIENYLLKHGIFYLPFDPYNRTFIENQASLLTLYELIAKDMHFSFTCSNVLNVIQNDDIIKRIISISSLFDKRFFTVYEGDRTGTGKHTKSDCYQRNQKISDYLDFFPNTPSYFDSKIIYDF